MIKGLTLVLTAAALLLALAVLASGVYTLAYAVRHSRYQADTAEAYHASRRADTADSWEAYIEPDPNRLFLPAEKQAGQMKPGMTLQKAVALLGKPQNCYMEEGRTIFVWRMKSGEAKVSFRADVNRGEFMGDSLFIEDVFIK